MEAIQINALLTSIANQDADVERINESHLPAHPDEEDEPLPPTKIYEKFVQSGHLQKMTNFTELEVISLFHDFSIAAARFPRRGPVGKINGLDALTLLLLFYRTGNDFETIAGFLDVGKTALISSIQRTATVLNQVLKSRWERTPERPAPLLNCSPNYKMVGALVDVQASECFKPRGRFEEAKVLNKLMLSSHIFSGLLGCKKSYLCSEDPSLCPCSSSPFCVSCCICISRSNT